MKKIKTQFIFFVIISTFLVSCKKENTTLLSESKKNIAGIWKISSVLRNGVDITNDFDFTGFTINFKDDGSYAIAKLVPFVVAKNGSWSLDDPTNPLHISFHPDGSTDLFVNEFKYPIRDGIRTIVLTGSPGCNKNTYQYTLVNGE